MEDGQAVYEELSDRGDDSVLEEKLRRGKCTSFRLQKSSEHDVAGCLSLRVLPPRYWMQVQSLRFQRHMCSNRPSEFLGLLIFDIMPLMMV